MWFGLLNIMISHKFDKTYFENGVEAHVSGYTDYHWKPEYVLPLANWLKQHFDHDLTFLDYGCAKGYLVKALRLLGVNAYGYDISEYAIANCDPDVSRYCANTLRGADIVICKDVLEHIPKSEILQKLGELANIGAETVVAIIPLGDDGKFRIREYELDVTHVTKEDEVWWITQFKTAGFDCSEFYYHIDGVKDNWMHHPYGNGVFIFRRTE
jgi:hypothetical protein